MENHPFLILLGLAGVVLFVLPARQRKRVQAQAQAMQEALTVGTPVMTTSGLHGTVAGLGDTTVDIEIAPGVVATCARPPKMEIRTPNTKPDDHTDSGTPGEPGGRPADGTL